jgi:GMP synthase (glutamine-hydrolysing)
MAERFMVAKIIAVRHDPEDVRDRCTLWLREAGYRVAAVCPAKGEAIPALDESIAGAVVFGGKYDVDMQGRYPFLGEELRYIEAVLKSGKPFLGICLGAQLLAHALGQRVGPHPRGFAEYGYYDLIPTPEGRHFAPAGLKVLQSHRQGWYDTPPGAVLLASTENFRQQAFRLGDAVFGLQFHPEATRASLERWVGKRPPPRHLLAGAHPPDRQLADNLRYDAALAAWFHGFLGAGEALREAAE